MDKYTISEQSYKNGYAAAMKEMKEKSKMQNINLTEYRCVIVTENAGGEPRMILAEDPVNLYADWRNEANMCPENDALVTFFMMNTVVVCSAKDGWDFQDVMDYIERHML